MGAGVAKQAAERFPHLPKLWGEHAIWMYGEPAVGFNIEWDARSHCIFFPTKPLDAERPSLSWKSPASIGLIARSTHELVLTRRYRREPVALPLVGCGRGGLSREQVLPVLEQLDDNFTLVES